MGTFRYILVITAFSWSALGASQEAFIKRKGTSGKKAKHFQVYDFANHGKARWNNGACENLANKRALFETASMNNPLEEHECALLNPEEDPVPSARAAADAQLFENMTVGELTGQAAIKYDKYLRAVERVYRKEARMIRINKILENPEAPAKRKAWVTKRLAKVQANLQKNIMHIDGLKSWLMDNGAVSEETNLDCPDAGLLHGESMASVFYPEEVEFYQSCSDKGMEVTLSCNNGVVEGDTGDLVGEIAECQVKEAPYVATEFALFGPGTILPQSSDTTLTDFASSVTTDDIRWMNGECRYLKFNYPYRLHYYTDLLDGAPLNPEDATSVGEEACEYLITLLP